MGKREGGINLRSRTKNDISYRKKYTYYYMITLAIPVVVLLFVNILIQNIVRQQVIASNNRTLKQFFYHMDEKLEGVLGDALTLTLNSNLDEYAELDRGSACADYYQKASAIALLNQSCADGAYEDVFIWFPVRDSVISGKNPITNSTTLEKYCTDYYSNPLMQKQIEEMARADPLHPVFWQIKQDFDNEAFLGITVHRFSATSRLQDHVVTLVMNRSSFGKELGKGVLTDKDQAMLFDRDGRRLFSYQDSELEALPEHCRASGSYEIEINGEKYTLLVQEAKVAKGFYTMLISQNDFYEPLTKIRTISFASIIFSIFMGFLTVRRMVRNTYRPLEEILEKIESALKQPFAGQKKSEFAFISEIISSREEEQKKDRLQRQQAADTAKRKHLLLAVLEGRNINETDIEQLETQYGQEGSFLVCALSLKDCGNVGWDLLPYIVDKEFSDCFASLCMYEILSVTSSNYVILLQTGESYRETELLDALQKGIVFLKQKCEVNAVLGISAEGKEIAGLHRLYRQATQALNYKFMQPEATVIQYRDIKERRFSLPFGEKTALFHTVRAFLQEEQSPKSTAEEFVAHLSELYGLNAESSIQNVEFFRYEMSNTLKGILLGTDLADSIHQSNIDNLVDANNLDGYLQKLTKILNGIKADLKETSQRQLLSAKIKKYVEQHYSEVELSVSLIGDVFGMQAAYLSQMFRESYGMRLVNYIAYVRVDRAKQLLSDTDLPIREIAAQVGFLSSGVFIKTFKKELGITPGQYRTSNTAL